MEDLVSGAYEKRKAAEAEAKRKRIEKKRKEKAEAELAAQEALKKYILLNFYQLWMGYDPQTSVL